MYHCMSCRLMGGFFMHKEKKYLYKKKSIRLAFPWILSMVILFLVGCVKEEKSNVSLTEQSEKEQSLESGKHIREETGIASNNPYNDLTYYENGFTYVKKGNTVSQIQDDSDSWEDIYSSTDADGMAFSGYKGALYVYNLFLDGTIRTEIIKINLDGSNPQKVLTYEGLVAGIYFNESVMYLNVPENNVNNVLAYKLENGMVGGKLYEIQNGELSLQLFTYDETGIYFCAFNMDDGTLYHIPGDTKQVKAVFKFRDMGVDIQDRNIEINPIHINIQKGYAYIWDLIDLPPVRKRLFANAFIDLWNPSSMDFSQIPIQGTLR